jgi:hypothetical protein
MSAHTGHRLTEQVRHTFGERCPYTCDCPTVPVEDPLRDALEGTARLLWALADREQCPQLTQTWRDDVREAALDIERVLAADDDLKARQEHAAAVRALVEECRRWEAKALEASAHPAVQAPFKEREELRARLADLERQAAAMRTAIDECLMEMSVNGDSASVRERAVRARDEATAGRDYIHRDEAVRLATEAARQALAEPSRALDDEQLAAFADTFCTALAADTKEG